MCENYLRPVELQTGVGLTGRREHMRVVNIKVVTLQSVTETIYALLEFDSPTQAIDRYAAVSLQVTQNSYPVTRINYWRNCAEGVWRHWHIGSDIWFQDVFKVDRAASQWLGILMKSRASIPW